LVFREWSYPAGFVSIGSKNVTLMQHKKMAEDERSVVSAE
jgi:hypothetical protein